MQQEVPRVRFATARLASGPEVHYAEQGDPDGEAIVFVHGWPDSWFSFSRVLALLPARYYAFASDQRGFGDSERPACCYTIDDLSADVVAFLDAAGIERNRGRAFAGQLHRPPGGRDPPRARGPAGADQLGRDGRQ
jgi:non-heme chloroperoxidase